MPHPFRVGITRDFLRPDGESIWPGLAASIRERLPGVEVLYLAERRPVITPDQLADLDAVISFGVRYDRASFARAERLVLLARYGVGYDSVDLAACTEADVILTITRGMAKRPVAEATLTLMLALGHQLLPKDRITRAGQWHERGNYHGVELRDRVVGAVGFGPVARELFRLLRPFGLRRAIAADPYVAPAAGRDLDVEVVPLEELLRTSDFVTLHCPLTEETMGLIGAEELALMRPDTFLVNTARGPIVDQPALTAALRARRIRGAALDVFAEEPVSPNDPLLRLDNVIVTPHALAWTEELFRDYSTSCIDAVAAVLAGRTPDHVVNRSVLDRPGLQAKLARVSGRAD
jgi:phosphoglycerate dehydrogenase-like enzyme